MKIEKIEIFKGTVYYKAPFKISLGTSEQSDEVLIKITDTEGNWGLGEAGPASRITGETQGTVIEASKLIASFLIGQETEDIPILNEKIESSILRNSSAKAAFDIALYDLLSRKYKIPLYKFLGAYRESIITDVTIGIMDIESAVKKATYLKNIGIKRIKMKVGENIVEDYKRVEAVRNAVGDNIEIFIDANQGWSPGEAVRNLELFDNLNIEFVEQPVKAWDIDGLAYVRNKGPLPVMADESVHSPEDAIKIVKAEAADFINIKLMKSGGIHNAKKIADISEAAGIPNMVGCMMEGAIGIAAGIHFSLHHRNVKFVDLDSDLDMKNTLTGGKILPLKGSYRTSDGYPGLGDLNLNPEEVQLVSTISKSGDFKSF